MARPRYNRPTDAELQIFDVLWSNPKGQTVRQVFNAVKAIRGSGYNATLKLMQIMHEKGLIARDDSVRPQVYKASQSRGAVQRSLVKDLLERVFHGDAGAMRTHLDSLRPSKGN